MQFDGLTQRSSGIELGGYRGAEDGRHVSNPQLKRHASAVCTQNIARLQSDPQLRQGFLEMQQRWLSLARSYEFLERLELLSAVEAKIKDVRLIIKDAA